jgi:hypothetical protein
MPRPIASEAAEELYSALDPAFTALDEDNDWTVLKLCIAIVAAEIDTIHTYVTDSDDGPGWQILLDPDRCPVEALPWLAQLAGATLSPDMDEAQQRAAIKSPEAFRRGTPAAIVQVAQRRLTGTRTVLFVERYTGLPYRMKIATLESETPDPALTEAEIIREQKPVGILLFFNSSPDWTWDELAAEQRTWDDVERTFATWDAVVTHQP